MSNEYILTDVVNAISHVLKFCRMCAQRLLAVRYSSIKNIIIWQVSLPYCHVIDLGITGKLQVSGCVFGLPKLFSPLGYALLTLLSIISFSPHSTWEPVCRVVLL